MKKKLNHYLTIPAMCLILGLTGCGGAEKAASENTQEAESGTSTDENAAADNTGEQAGEDAGNEASGSSANIITPIIYELPAEAEEADVYVEPIEGLAADFIRGVDISSVIAEEESGVVYYNEEGQEQDIFQTLAQNGVNYIRVRVWNDPYDAEGNSYGGGHNDTDTAAKIGVRAAAYGMKLCVDYHYSDFWADPSKQQCPKAWEGMSIEEKSEALYQYTKESLTQIIDAGAVVGMVQIGNEINNGMSGESEWGKKGQLLRAGSKAVREVAQEKGQDILIAVHFTDISDKDGTIANAQKLLEKEVDYDVFAVSYYPFWHGTLENLADVLHTISGEYGKKVVVAENSYLYTTGDGDGSGNSVDEGGLVPEYAANEQGQANEVRDVCAAVASIGDAGLGLFYWEPAWIPVNVYDATAAGAADALAANKEAWESKGSGWASSYAGDYDPKDAGKNYGGSSWDNQALFDFEGHPLESLKVFKYLHCGTLVEQKVESIPVVEVNVPLGGELEMPEKATVLFNDRSSAQVSVEWDQEALAAIDTSVSGEYEVNGMFTDEPVSVDGTETTSTTIEQLPEEKVTAVIYINQQNLLVNNSFEEADTSMWEIEGNATDFQNKESDACSGVMSLHFWSESAVSFTVEQTVTGLEPGTYEFGLYLQGGDAGADAQMYIYADNGTEQLTQDTEVDGWCNWKNPVISEITVGDDGTLTVGASISCAAKGWGTLDDFYLHKK
ncbi:MAG: glycosyl hydrolase 53 family protein [Roseburia sp.]|nr:glycosyl hydrolase 53 family protein [Roseburia sp.]MCM1242986.1 glycosyl hydrolase 53 family protein [Roseburia sp.]